ncbi:MAG: arylesterase [Candidatus Binatia bacterium]|nr:MAG: arylesterase [Candidatus Binatia bacterium]
MPGSVRDRRRRFHCDRRSAAPRRLPPLRPRVACLAVLLLCVLACQEETEHPPQVSLERGPEIHDCRRIERIEGQQGELLGVEDITIDPRTGYAYLSSHDRRHWRTRGGIYGFDLSKKPLPDAAEPLTPDMPPIFRPHGISLATGKNGDWLFVVNHAGDKDHRIERFAVRGRALVYEPPAVAGPELTSPNDVYAVDADELYVTNDHGSATRVGKIVEDLLDRRIGNIVRWDGKSLEIVESGLSYANGIQGNAEGSMVYVTTTRPRTLRIYERELTGRLRLVREVFLDTLLDNIEIDSDGSLWIGAHPSAWAFLLHAGRLRKYAPSQVLRVTIRGDQVRAEERFRDRGEQISASSVAAPWGPYVLVGSVFDRGFLLCERS